VSSNKRNVTSIKPQNDGSDLTIIIPAAGAAHRMRSLGPKCLIDINGKTVLERIIDNCNSYYPLAQVVVVTGFQSDKVANSLKSRAVSVENERFEETNVVRSIAHGLRTTNNNKVLIIFGDLVFDSSALIDIEGTSKALIDISGCFDDHHREIGVRLANNFIDNFSYSFAEKWAQITFLTGKELSLLRKLCFNRENEKLYLFEIFNMILERGGQIEGKKNPRCRVMDIDTLEDIEKARGIFNV